MGKHHPRRSGIVDLFNSQGGFCCYCCKPMTLAYGKTNSITRDHVVPRSQGGSSRESNIAGACYKCNQEKRDMPLVIFLLKRNAGPSAKAKPDRVQVQIPLPLR